MNARRLAFAATILLGTPCADAQNTTPKPRTQPALEVLRKFKEPDAGNAARGQSPLDSVTARAGRDAGRAPFRGRKGIS